MYSPRNIAHPPPFLPEPLYSGGKKASFCKKDQEKGGDPGYKMICYFKEVFLGLNVKMPSRLATFEKNETV